MSDSDDSRGEDDRDSFRRVKGPADVQRLRLERLMKDPEKEAHIPEPPKSKPPPAPAEYVRFYMGSSAGAGSGEFHIYRNLRRKEQNRMRYIDEQAKKDALQSEFEISMAEKKRKAEDKVAKNRAKRQKKKAKQRSKKSKATTDPEKSSDEEEDSDDGAVPSADATSSKTDSEDKPALPDSETSIPPSSLPATAGENIAGT